MPSPRWPRARCRSEWHTPAAATRTSTSSWCGGCSSSRSTLTGAPWRLEHRRPDLDRRGRSCHPVALECVQVGLDAQTRARRRADRAVGGDLDRGRQQPVAPCRPATPAGRTAPRRTGRSRTRARRAGLRPGHSRSTRCAATTSGRADRPGRRSGGRRRSRPRARRRAGSRRRPRARPDRGPRGPRAPSRPPPAAATSPGEGPRTRRCRLSRSGSSSHSIPSGSSARAHCERGRDVPARRAVAGHPPALIRIDHDPHIRPDRIPHRLHHLHVAAPVVVVKAQLDGANARVAQRDAARRPLRGPPAARRWRRRRSATRCGRRAAATTAAPVPARRRPTRPPRASTAGRRGSRPSRTPRARPRCGTDRPPAAAARAPPASGSASPLAHPRTPSSVVTSTSVASWCVARLGVPGRVQRRIELEPVRARLDRGDPHAALSRAPARATARRAPPPRRSSNPRSISSSGRRCEISRSSGSRPRR